MSEINQQVEVHSPNLPVASRLHRPRVMLFTDSFLRGGTERQFVRAAKSLDRARFDLMVGCLRREGPLLASVEALGIPILEFPLNSLHNFRAAHLFWKLVSYLRGKRIQILHAFDFYTSVFATPAGRLAGVPVVLASRRELANLRGVWQRQAIRLACRLATGVVVNSRAAARDLVEGHRGNAQRIGVIPNSIDLEQFRAVRTAEEVRKEFGIRRDAPLVGTLANLRSEKDLPTFLRAVRRVNSIFPDSRFLMIGDGPERTKLESLAQDLGLSSVVSFAGDRSDVPDLLAALDVFVLSSRTESFPNAVLEAMAMARAVVATRVGGVPELVEDGESGYLVPPGDAEAMAERIVQLLRDASLCDSMGWAGLERVEREFTTEQVKRKLEDFYDHLLGLPGARPRASGCSEIHG
jgi:L-malate glycosyltransferase